MLRLVFLGLLAFAVGIQTSVSIPALLHVFGAPAAIYYTYAARKSIANWPLSLWALVTFGCITVISGIINFTNLHEAGKSLGSVKYILFGVCFSFALKAYKQSSPTKQIKVLTTLLAFAVIVAATYGLIRSELGFNLRDWKFQYYSPRAGGFYGYMRYAYNLQYIIVGFFSLLLFHKHFAPYIRRPWIVVGLLFACIGLFFSETRGAVLATAAGVIVLSCIRDKTWGKRVALLGILSFTLVLGYVSLKPRERVEADAAYGSDSFRMLESLGSRSNSLRISQFKSALYAFKEKPLLGFGPGQLRFHIDRIKKKYQLEHQDYVNQHAHNIFLEILANTGLLGFIAFCAWLCLWGSELYRSTGTFCRYIALPAFVVTIISGQVEYLFSATGSFTIYLIYSCSVAENLLLREQK